MKKNQYFLVYFNLILNSFLIFQNYYYIFSYINLYFLFYFKITLGLKSICIFFIMQIQTKIQYYVHLIIQMKLFKIIIN